MELAVRRITMAKIGASVVAVVAVHAGDHACFRFIALTAWAMRSGSSQSSGEGRPL
jgi:hypothetical protein